MKTKMMIFMLICILSACDPVTIVDYKIANSSDKLLTIYFYRAVDAISDTLQVQPKSAQFWQTISVGADTPEKVDFRQYYDSISIDYGSKILLKYTPESINRTIYDFSYWTEHKKGRGNYEYTFEITEEDISPDGGS